MEQSRESIEVASRISSVTNPIAQCYAINALISLLQSCNRKSGHSVDRLWPAKVCKCSTKEKKMVSTVISYLDFIEHTALSLTPFSIV